jgi:hypothetical protein
MLLWNPDARFACKIIELDVLKLTQVLWANEFSGAAQYLSAEASY